MQSLIHPIAKRTQSIIHSVDHSEKYSLTHTLSVTHSVIQTLTHWNTHTRTNENHLLTKWTYTFTQSNFHSVNRSHNVSHWETAHSLGHSFTYSFNRVLTKGPHSFTISDYIPDSLNTQPLIQTDWVAQRHSHIVHQLATSDHWKAKTLAYSIIKRTSSPNQTLKNSHLLTKRPKTLSHSHIQSLTKQAHTFTQTF